MIGKLTINLLILNGFCSVFDILAPGRGPGIICKNVKDMSKNE
jgi:hypothetical protein